MSTDFQEQTSTMKSAKRRLANDDDRKTAAQWVEWFDSREPVMLTSGPNGEERYRPVDAHDLATVLKMFAENGTFRARPEAHRMVRRLLVNFDFAALRKAGDTYEIAVEKVAAKHRCSETTVRNSLSRRNRVRLVRSPAH